MESHARPLPASFAPVRDCWFLTGPTASGKTRVGIILAELLHAEILSLDSMAVFRGMDIGTAKPTRADRALIPHHLLDLASPADDFSLAQYLAEAHARIAEVKARGKTVLFVGGTPLYLKALLRGLCEGPPPDWEFREAIEREVQETGVAALHERLRLVDPLAAAKLHPHDKRRIIRALEVNRLTGRPLSHLQTQFDETADESQGRVFGLEWPRPELHERIERRVVSMFEQGLVEEVERLCREHSALSRTASQAVGYREVLEFLRGARSLDETIALVQARTRQFARRQETWFRGLTECRRVAMREAEDPSETARRILVGATATDSSSDAL
jgi:tRNA dimethylallyltransferase